jgi:hypothetical protein
LTPTEFSSHGKQKLLLIPPICAGFRGRDMFQIQTSSRTRRAWLQNTVSNSSLSNFCLNLGHCTWCNAKECL